MKVDGQVDSLDFFNSTSSFDKPLISRLEPAELYESRNVATFCANR